MIPAVLQLLAADGSTLLRAGVRVREGKVLEWQGPAWMIAIAALAAVTVWLASAWLKSRHRRNRNSPLRLWKELCAAHHLNHRERSLLARLAEHHHLLQPATLFIEPRLWELAEVPVAGSARAAELAALREKIFRQS